MRSDVEAAFARALDRRIDHVLRVRIRLVATPSGELHCRARLFPVRGHSLVASASATFAGDAAHATAQTLTRLLVRRLDAERRARRGGGSPSRAGREDDGNAFVSDPGGGPARVDDDWAEEVAEEFVWAVTGSDEPQAGFEADGWRSSA